MALSKKSVEKACAILRDINPKADNSPICKYTEANELKENVIFGLDEIADGYWKNVFMNIRDITPEQLALFNKRKDEVLNTSFIAQKNDLTTLGWLQL